MSAPLTSARLRSVSPGPASGCKCDCSVNPMPHRQEATHTTAASADELTLHQLCWPFYCLPDWFAHSQCSPGHIRTACPDRPMQRPAAGTHSSSRPSPTRASCPTHAAVSHMNQASSSSMPKSSTSLTSAKWLVCGSSSAPSSPSLAASSSSSSSGKRLRPWSSPALFYLYAPAHAPCQHTRLPDSPSSLCLCLGLRLPSRVPRYRAAEFGALLRI